jgi:hypothetical protein
MEDKKEIRNKIDEYKDFQQFINSKGGEKFMDYIVENIIGSIIKLYSVKISEPGKIMDLLIELKASLRVYMDFYNKESQIDSLREVLKQAK